MLMPKTNLRDNINCDYSVKKLCDRHNEVNKKVLDHIKDRDGLRAEEIAEIAGPNASESF